MKPNLRSTASVLLLIVVALTLSACGQSKEEKAKKQQEQALADVCSARADISTRVTRLKDLDLSNFTINGVKDDIDAITKDVKTMIDAEQKLAPQRKSAIEAATKKFEAKVQDTASNLLTNLSLTDAAAQLQSAGLSLASAYSTELASFSCPSGG